MSRVLLVRHAQASFLEQDYDKLSATGEMQSRLLGEYWARRQERLDRIVSGPRRRQQDTAKIVRETCARAGVSLPEAEVMPEFDEFQGESVLQRSLPGLLERDEKIRRLHAAFESSEGRAERVKNFQKIFEAVIGRWVEGKLPVDGVESWPQFCARVERGLAQVIADGRGRDVAIFSSGGPVSVTLQRALELSPQKTLQVAWMVRNCATSEFLASGERFTLSSFNEVPHLEDAALITYR